MSEKPTIPSWQRAQATPSSQSPPSPPLSSPSTSPDQTATPSSEQQPDAESDPTSESQESSTDSTPSQQSDASALRDQASRFLQDPAIQNAPRERKVAFLESKGVGADEIENLLGSQQLSQDFSSHLSEAGENAWSTAPPKATSTPVPAPAPPPPRDIPPIVTYPEFLAQPPQQPPLITTQRLLNTAYITGGLISTMYGLSKYIIAPMTQTLFEARHEFATHTQEQLEDLNKRLKDSVSIDPATKIKNNSSDVAEDVSEADSDPTELYHRDYGTQTSPGLSRRPSLASTSDDNDVVKSHENRLKIMTSHLRELQSARTDNSSSASLQTKVSDLTTYLSEMSYMNQYYSAGTGGFYAGSYGGFPRSKDGKDDQIEALRGDIRAVKGVFLSARNFPAGGRGGVPTGGYGV